MGIWDMKFKFNVLDAIKRLSPKYVFIVTNQEGIEKGFVSENHFNHKMQYIVSCIGEYCDAICYYKYSSVNESEDFYRKPNIGMLEDCMKYVLYTRKDCLMIGDASGLEGQFSDTDKKTAENFSIDYLDVNKFIELISTL